MYDANRVVEVKCGKSEGTGYLIAPRLILTAWHVVKPWTSANDAAPIQVRVLGEYRAAKAKGEDGLKTSPARIIWPKEDPGEDLDFALLVVDSRKNGREEPTAWMSLPSVGVVDVEGIGFPDHKIFVNRFLRAIGLSAFRERDTAWIKGRVAAGSDLKQREYRSGTFDVVLRQEDVPQGSKEGWAGMSGAALFAGRNLVGIVKLVSEVRQLHRLKALPVERLFNQPEVRAAIHTAGVAMPQRTSSGSAATTFNAGTLLHLLDRRDVCAEIEYQLAESSGRQDAGGVAERSPVLLALRVRQDDDVQRLIRRLADVEFQKLGFEIIVKGIEWPDTSSGPPTKPWILRQLKAELSADASQSTKLLEPADVASLLPDNGGGGSVLFVHTTIPLEGYELKPGHADLLEWWRSFWCGAASTGVRVVVLIAFEEDHPSGACCVNPTKMICEGTLARSRNELPVGADISWRLLGPLTPISRRDATIWLDHMEHLQLDSYDAAQQAKMLLDVGFDKPGVLPRGMRCVKLALPTLMSDRNAG